MADSGKSSAQQAGHAAGSLSDSDIASFQAIQANQGLPLDEDDASKTGGTMPQSPSVVEPAPVDEPDDSPTSGSFSGDVDPHGETSPLAPPAGRPAPPAAPSQAKPALAHAPPPPGPLAVVPNGGSAKPTDASDADAATLAKLIEASILEPPDTAAQSRGAVALLEKRYELKRKLGEGGMGVVFLAFDRLGDCDVAIKTLRHKFLHDAAARRGFIAEAVQMNKVPGHAHVLVVKGIGSETKPYYVMEHMPGGSLGKLIRKEGPLPRDKAIRLAFDIAKAVEYLHVSGGHIHRDIKPENVLIAADGSAWLCDFGLIRQVGIGAAGLRAGTLAYMPPEVVTDLAKNVAFDWDIYSFGAVLYEMICGKRPYDELFNAKSNPVEQMRLMKDEVTRRPPKAIQEVCRKADPALTRIAQWCMARIPRDRYSNITDVLTDLDRVRQNKQPLGPRQSVPMPSGSSPIARIVVALLLLVIAALGAIWITNSFDLRSKILAGLGFQSGPSVPPPPTDGGAGDPPLVPNPLVDVKTGHPVLDAVNPKPQFTVTVTTLQGKTAFVDEDRISVEVRYDRPCHVTVLLVPLDDATVQVLVLFPNAVQMSDALPVPKSPLVIPSEEAVRLGHYLEVGGPHGRFLLKVIATTLPLLLSDGVDHKEEGFRMLDLKKLKASVAGPDGPKAIERVEDAFNAGEFSTSELLIVTKPK